MDCSCMENLNVENLEYDMDPHGGENKIDPPDSKNNENLKPQLLKYCSRIENLNLGNLEDEFTPWR